MSEKVETCSLYFAWFLNAFNAWFEVPLIWFDLTSSVYLLFSMTCLEAVYNSYMVVLPYENTGVALKNDGRRKPEPGIKLLNEQKLSY